MRQTNALLTLVGIFAIVVGSSCTSEGASSIHPASGAKTLAAAGETLDSAAVRPAPVFSTDQCYFTSYPVHSNHCVTAPCEITNVTEAAATCKGNDTAGFDINGAIYMAWVHSAKSSGEVIGLVANAAVRLPSCVDGTSANAPGDPGDYYGPGAVVVAGASPPSNCVGAIEPFPTVVAPALVLAPERHDFRVHVDGRTTKSKTFSVGNTGTSPTGTLSVAVTGPNANDFIISNDNCSGTANGGPQCTIDVSFQPSTTSDEEAKLEITANPGGTVRATLLGAGGVVGPPVFSTNQCYFTSYPEGSNHCVTAPCEITNAPVATATCHGDGYKSFDVGGAVYSVYSDASKSDEFELVGLYPNAAVTFPSCIAGMSTSIPSDSGDYYATGVAVGPAGSTPPADCAGTIVPFGTATPAELVMDPPHHNFGTYVEGHPSKSLTISVGNLGTQPTGLVSVTMTGANASDFTITSSNCVGTLSDGPSCGIDVTFTPSTSGTEKATLEVTANPGGSVLTTLVGDGGVVGPPQFSTEQCYFKTYPETSHHCVTAPCKITNPVSATATCHVSGYVNYEVDGVIYGAFANRRGDHEGFIEQLYPSAATTFPACLDKTATGEPSDPGDYYEIAEVTTGAAPPTECEGTIGTFP